MIKLKNNFDILIEKCFKNHILFQDAKNRAFSHLMSKEHYSKQLANFCDYEMKIGIKGADSSKIDEKIDDIMNIFKCLNNKMIFQFDYTKKLSDRLLANKTISLDAEKKLITKLKVEQGVSYVSKLTTMMDDLENTSNIMDLYRTQDNKNIFIAQILQNGAWEIEKSKFEKFCITSSMKSMISSFEAFYYKKFKSHKLYWANLLGSTEIKFCNYLKKNYQSTSTPIQYCILLLLEKSFGKKNITVEEISAKLQLSSTVSNILIAELMALIYSPSFNPKKDPKCGIILSNDVNSQNDELSLKSEVWLNENFTSNSIKFNTIPGVIKVSNFY